MKMNKKELYELILTSYGQACAFQYLNEECEDAMCLLVELKAAKETALELRANLAKAVRIMNGA